LIEEFEDLVNPSGRVKNVSMWHGVFFWMKWVDTDHTPKNKKNYTWIHTYPYIYNKYFKPDFNRSSSRSSLLLKSSNIPKIFKQVRQYKSTNIHQTIHQDLQTFSKHHPIVLEFVLFPESQVGVSQRGPAQCGLVRQHGRTSGGGEANIWVEQFLVNQQMI
jgi:hypothetical protein